MTNPIPTTRTAAGPDGQSSDRAALNKGDTHWSQQAEGPQPRQPNERDESADDQSAAQADPSDKGHKAHADIARGAQDTDRGPVMDQVYNDKVLAGSPKK